MDSEPTVYVVDDDPGLRHSLAELMESVGHPYRMFSSSSEFRAGYDRSKPGCLVLDIRLERDNGLDVQEDLARTGIDIPVIILTGHGDVAHCRRAFKSGAIDFLEKPVDPERLLECVSKGIAIDREAREKATERREIERRVALLTPRERDVLELLLDAKTSRDIGDTLGISGRTVEKHRREILRKLEVESAAAVIRTILESGVLSPDSKPTP